MISKKFQKYMEQYQEQNYAIKTRKLEKGDIRKYKNGNENQDTKASYCDSIEYGKEEQEKVINETDREEKSSKAHKERRQRISCTDQGRCKAEKTNIKVKNGEEEMKEKMTIKEKKHEAKEGKRYEKLEDKREAKKIIIKKNINKK